MRLPATRATFLASLIMLSGCVSDGPQQIAVGISAHGLAYDLAGEGPLVVLIHGTNLDRRMWDEEVVWLRERARVLRYDLRGQGGSDFPTESYSNHADLLELMDELGESEAVLIGLSAGAQVALDAALQAPRRVRRMALASPSLLGYVPGEMPPYFADLMDALRAGDFRRANEALLASSLMSVPPEYAARVRRMVEENERLWTIPYSLVEQASPPAIERLEEIETPTLILVGEEDVAAIRAQGALLERRLPNARRVSIARGGHLLNMTSAESFRKEILAFLGFSND